MNFTGPFLPPGPGTFEALLVGAFSLSAVVAAQRNSLASVDQRGSHKNRGRSPVQRDFSSQREDPMKTHPLGSSSKGRLSSSMLNVAAD